MSNTPSNLEVFCNVQQKEDSPEKLAAVAGKPTKQHLFSSELNLMVAKINRLKQLLDQMYVAAEADANNQIIELGEIGNTAIHIAVRNLTPAREVQASFLRVFKSIRNGIESNYLYTGPGGLIGLNQIQPLATEFFAISGNFLATGAEILVHDPTAAPDEVITVLQVALNNLYSAILNSSSTLQQVLDAGNIAYGRNIELIHTDEGVPTGFSATLEAIGGVNLRKDAAYVEVNHAGIEFSNGINNVNIRQKLAGTFTLFTPTLPDGEYHMATMEQVEEMLSDGVFTTQEITSGGNYNNLEVTADLLVFKNENAQAILNGVWGRKEFHILNLSTTYEVKINHNSGSVTGNGKPIKLPTAAGNMGVKGTARVLYTEGYGYFVADTWGSRYRPEFKGLTEKKLVTVDENSNADVMEMIEFLVFRDAQSVAMTKAELNSVFPLAKRPFQVVCPTLNLIYMKTDNNTNSWKSIPLTNVT